MPPSSRGGFSACLGRRQRQRNAGIRLEMRPPQIAPDAPQPPLSGGRRGRDQASGASSVDAVRASFHSLNRVVSRAMSRFVEGSAYRDPFPTPIPSDRRNFRSVRGVVSSCAARSVVFVMIIIPLIDSKYHRLMMSSSYHRSRQGARRIATFPELFFRLDLGAEV